MKRGEPPGYPRFQDRNQYASFTYPQAGLSMGNGRLALSKIRHIKMKRHRGVGGAVKT
ncbi:hypothetical protein [Ktedonospora formicarum]|uniref:Uncharacterized protein n=1 Tax=Ktedonospora formicarum TaxID=2778364 RepID=A0A8J3MN13_9CHLR|nr:hypothetical protein [Ktedonospora formicarum]GHO42222.1 hypothetical protein KSX_03850 [Ktedonospora formicarum]